MAHEIAGNGCVITDPRLGNVTLQSCHNREPRRKISTYDGKDGYDDMGRMLFKQIHTQWDTSRECMYDKSTTDPRCAGCRWRKNND